MLRLRLCYLMIDCLFDEKCSLRGSIYKDFTDTLLSGFNVSRIGKPASLRSPVNDKGKAIDEYLLSIQRNESDVTLFPYSMPVIMSNIKTGPVFFSDKIAILFTYRVKDGDSNPTILDTFDTFDMDVLTLILNFLVILAVLISFSYMLERKGTPPRCTINGPRFNLRFIPSFIFSFFVKQFASFPGNMTASTGLLTCCLLTFSYFVTFFYSSMIKTDMVTVKAPRVIGSYQDILADPEIEPYIRHNFDEYISFKKAPFGSLKRKIWDRVVKMGVAELVYDNRKDGDIPLLDLRHPFMNTKTVIMIYSRPAHGFKYAVALYFKTLENRRALGVIDPTDSEKVSTSVINRMTSGALSHKYETRMRRFFEGNFWQKVIDNGGLQYAEFLAERFGVRKDISDADEYAGRKVILAKPVLIKPNITYFMSLFILYLVLCFIQLIVFLVERWVSDEDEQ